MIRLASSSWCWSSSSLKRNRMRERRNGDCSDQAGNAFLAAATASFTVTAEARATWECTLPRAGLNTSAVRSAGNETTLPSMKCPIRPDWASYWEELLLIHSPVHCWNSQGSRAVRSERADYSESSSTNHFDTLIYQYIYGKQRIGLV
ncbi:hypothetical protein D3C75_1084450 [compost metagenome]